MGINIDEHGWDLEEIEINLGKIKNRNKLRLRRKKIQKHLRVEKEI